MLHHSWSTVYTADPTLIPHYVYISYLLGRNNIAPFSQMPRTNVGIILEAKFFLYFCEVDPHKQSLTQQNKTWYITK